MGWIALAIGIAIRFLIGRRKFNRRAVTGVEQFSSYGKSVAVSWLEKLFKVIGLALMLLGLILIYGGWSTSKKEAQKQLMEDTQLPK